MDVRDNQLYIGGVSAIEIAEKYGTPVYVYDENIIRERAEGLLRSIEWPNKEIKYACKANTNPSIMKILKEYGIGIDAVSLGEVYCALRCGFPREAILFTSNNASFTELEYAIREKILINIDSLSQLEMVGKKYTGLELCVRINPNVGAGHHQHVITGGPESKFGISYRDVEKIKEIASKYSLRIKGLHQHIGSGILETEIYLEAVEVLLDVAEAFDSLDFIDFGGGIGIPYRESEKPIDIEDLGKKITKKFADFCKKYGREIKLCLEPGRYFVAESGFLLARVTAVKKEEKYRFVGTDTGFNHLIRPAMYGSYHRIINAGCVNGKKVRQVVVGNICESGDVFTRDEKGIVERELPLFKEGDLVCICNAGAYGFSMASNYNSRPRPPEVLVGNGKMRLIRERETIEDIFRGCVDL